MRVLVVDDDQDYAEIISRSLELASHETIIASSANAALNYVAKNRPDIAVLDVMLPDSSGLALCKELRERVPDLPVLFLSSLDRSGDIVAGFTHGGDDYVTKPFHPRELIARVSALARRTHPTPTKKAPVRCFAVGSLELDVSNQAARFDGKDLGCTRTEFELLAQLATYPGQVLSHEFLTEQVWGYHGMSDAVLLKGHVSAVRRKLRNAGGDPDMIRTVHGIGYGMFEV